MTIFDSFVEVPYTHLVIKRGGVMGNTIISEEEHTGVFKLRSSSTSDGNMSSRSSTATLHVHPEDYCKPYQQIVGQGVRVDGVEYQITNVTGGMNFANGIMEHLTLTLDRADYAKQGECRY